MFKRRRGKIGFLPLFIVTMIPLVVFIGFLFAIPVIQRQAGITEEVSQGLSWLGTVMAIVVSTLTAMVLALSLRGQFQPSSPVSPT